MAYHTEPAVLKEVILWKKNTLQEVKNEIKDTSTKIALLQLQDQDVSESNTQLQPLEPQELEFRRLKTELDAALDRAVNLANSITWHTSMLSHIQILPAELLSYIFFLTLDHTSFPEWTPSSFPPLIYARVCSSWHATVLSTPLLWSSVSIFIMPGRNWSVPLSLELIWHPKVGDPRIHATLRDLVVSSSFRWKRLQLFVPDDTLEIILAQPLPALEYLGLGSETSEFTKPIAPLARSDFVPSLQTVSFLNVRSSALAWDMPWSQLTEINSKGLRCATEILWLLHRCSSLKRCCLRLSRHNHIIQFLNQRLWFWLTTGVVFFQSSTLRRLLSALVMFWCYEMELRDTVKCIPSLKEKDTVPQGLKDLLLGRSHEDLR
ncbi:hypothetical protein BDP27DRAFT_1321623 [Rhodocollybia butyracea]|uniref:F-box domain-containing protein n=1 Tax=Rhodocollybia butyracea TaxID=206335 RepID=A0A9P5Q017_9AGAR|nr:hypothetical protein BDP27DRAFT_1321623 [Rhodocollybia butyracea]